MEGSSTGRVGVASHHVVIVSIPSCEAMTAQWTDL
jgi:hypothetical protein